MNFLEALNDAQRAAVTYTTGPCLVVAGAGSGKTRVLTFKIAYLLSQGIYPGHILALTFTNKAAREMKQRITTLITEMSATGINGFEAPEQLTRLLWMGTFHSIAARILRTHAEKLGYTHEFTIYDAADQKSLVKKIIRDLQLDDKIYKSGLVISRISAAKCNHISPADYQNDQAMLRADKLERLYRLVDIYAEYERRLKASNAMDFDDLLVKLHELLTSFSEVREQYQQRFEHVLVDEYQDTNPIQYKLVRLLGEPQNRVSVVGDDAQSIYSFRGATIRNILEFQSDYAGAEIFKLERNYRSTKNIVNAANSLIHKNREQIYKDVYSEREEGERLRLVRYDSDKDESAAVAKQVLGLHRKNGYAYEDIAILYRTNAQSRGLEDELRKLSIPYRIYGGMGFYQRKEIKDAIAYFRLIVNHNDEEALRRIINVPRRGIGNTTLEKITSATSLSGISLWQALTNVSVYAPQVSSATQKRISDFIDKVNSWTNASYEKNAYHLTTQVLAESGLMADAVSDTTAEGIERKNNLDELLRAIHQYVEDRTEESETENSAVSIRDFLGEVSLLSDQDEQTDDTTPRVTMMTIHSAKGLEFPVVFIVGLEEDLFPSPFCQSAREIEEERRLLYVAITRAEKECFLTYASRRWINGKMAFSNPSRFIRDIDRQYISTQNPTPTQTKTFYTDQQSMRFFQLYNVTSSTSKAEEKSPTENKIVDTVISGFMRNDRIRHHTFGEGTVIKTYKENDNQKIDILFDKFGKKTLLLTYAKLEKI